MTETALQTELVELTRDLVAFASTEDRPDQVVAVMDYAAQYLERSAGLHLHYSMGQHVPALVVTTRATRSPEIMLNAHLDVVAARPEQFSMRVEGGRLYGRAVQDMKGSAAVLMRLVRDLAALPEPPDIGLQLVGDEEIGGEDGTGRLAAEGWSCRFFLAAEPTDLRICYQQKGIIWAEARLPGRPSHGSRPWEGENAILALGRSLARLEQRFAVPPAEAWITTVTPTVVQGGTTRNRLAEAVDVTLDVRYVPEDDPAQVMAAVQACFSEGQVAVVRSANPLDTDPAHPYIQRLARVAEQVTGRPTELYREHFGSDGRFYTERGIPAVNFGPVGAGLHSDNEWVDIASLVQLYHSLWQFLVHA